VERRRRENINQVIVDLSRVVPQCHPGQSKGLVLNSAYEFVKIVREAMASGDLVFTGKAVECPLLSALSRKRARPDETEEGADDQPPAKEVKVER